MASVFDIKGFNELTANQLGVSTEYNDNTPLSYIFKSMETIGNYFQQSPNRIRSSAEWDRIIRENTPPQERGNVERVIREGTPQIERIEPDPYGISKEAGKAAKDNGECNCSFGDLPCYLGCAGNNDTVKDYTKRFGILIFSVIILILGVISLR